MQLGSIHKDEKSARKAAAALVRAGIERERVHIVRPRAFPKAASPQRTQHTPAKKLRPLDVLSGAAFGGACGALACAVLAIVRMSYFVADPAGAMLAILLASALAGAGVSIFARRGETHAQETPKPEPVVSRTRRTAWAVVVDARDAAQGALAAAALKSA
jgi:hypothetical protein